MWHPQVGKASYVGKERAQNQSTTRTFSYRGIILLPKGARPTEKKYPEKSTPSPSTKKRKHDQLRNAASHLEREKKTSHEGRRSKSGSKVERQLFPPHKEKVKTKKNLSFKGKERQQQRVEKRK